jgi:hypothetical protein
MAVKWIGGKYCGFAGEEKESQLPVCGYEVSLQLDVYTMYT